MLSFNEKTTSAVVRSHVDDGKTGKTSLPASTAESNPIQLVADQVLRVAVGAYNNYLYGSGVLLCLACLWTAYPSFARYRHAHLMRYQRRQVEFQRWFFATPHIPRWDRKYFEKLTIRSLSPSSAEVGATDICGKVESIEAEQPACSAFAAAASEASHKKLLTHVHAINARRLTVARRRVGETADRGVEVAALQRVLSDAVRAAGFVVVDKESTACATSGAGDRSTSQVWLLSSEEARRREFCRFWIGVLVLARVMQDLLYVPDFPDSPVL